MNELVAGVSATFGVAGLLLLVGGLRRTERPERVGGASSLDRARRSWGRMSRGARLHWAGSFAAGFVVFALTGWVVALVIVPVLALGLPALLGEPVNREVQLLEALDRWVRNLSGSLPTGKSVPDAIRATVGQAPDVIAREVRLLVARLDDRWVPEAALRAFADDLDNAESDAIVAALVLCTSRGGVGAAATLHELADSIHDRLRALREIEAERAKPRVVVRQVTAISLLVLGLLMVFNRGYFAPYSGPLGQVLLGCLLTCFVLPLVVLRRMTQPRRRERILRRATSAPRPEAVASA